MSSSHIFNVCSILIVKANLISDIMRFKNSIEMLCSIMVILLKEECIRCSDSTHSILLAINRLLTQIFIGVSQLNYIVSSLQLSQALDPFFSLISNLITISSSRTLNQLIAASLFLHIKQRVFAITVCDPIIRSKRIQVVKFILVYR